MSLFSSTIHAQSSVEKWKELQEFHQVIAQTFHPAEDGDFKPIKERSGELAEKARLLSESKIPAEFSKPEMRQAIQELNAGCRKLNAMIQGKTTDEEIKKSLSAIHDTFHKIYGMCQPGDKKEMQQEHQGHNDSNPKK
jgi:hypothetical protein